MVRYFLSVHGVAGDASEPGVAGWIRVRSLSWQAANASGSGAGAGKAVFDRLSATIPTRPAGPILFVKCSAGEHVRHAELRGFRGNSLVVAARMSDLLVESCRDTPDYLDEARTEVVLAFANVQLVDGTAARP